MLTPLKSYSNLINTINRNGNVLNEVCSIQLCWNALLEENAVKIVHSQIGNYSLPWTVLTMIDEQCIVTTMHNIHSNIVDIAQLRTSGVVGYNY